jgi:hypothetical protein
MGAEYLSHVKSIAIFAPTFYGYIISVLTNVKVLSCAQVRYCPVLAQDLNLQYKWAKSKKKVIVFIG